MRKKKRDPIIADLPAMAVNLDSPTVQQRRRQQRRRVRLAWTLVIVGVIGAATVGANAVALLTEDSRDDPSTAGTTPGRAEAWLALERWLEFEPSPLPGGQVLSWDGVTVTDVDATQQGQVSYSVEVHTFTLASGQALFESTVQVYVDAAGAAPMATPSLLPLAAASDIPTGVTTWPGYEDGPSTNTATAAVESWATAFVSGDPEALKFTVNDSDVNAYYVPLTSVESVTTNVTETGTPIDGDTNQLIARVELSIVWASQPGTDEGDTTEGDTTAEPPVAQIITYDVLLTGVGTGSPRVVSWGGPGSGPLLEPYSVALTYDTGDLPEVTAPPTPTPSTPPSESGDTEGEQP